MADDSETVNPLCRNCKHYKPHKPMRSPFVFGLWVGDGRYKIGRRENDYTTVEGDYCKHHEEAK